MNNKLIMTIVGMALCIILVGSVLAPVIDDAQESTYGEKSNLNSIIKTRMSNDPTEDLTYTLDKTAITYPDGTTGGTTNFAGTTFFINYVPQGTWWYGDYYDLTVGHISAVSQVVVHADKTLTITYGTSNLTYTSAPNEEIYYPDPEGSYALVGNDSCLISDNNTAFCALYTTTTSIDTVSRGVLAIGQVSTEKTACTTSGVLDLDTNEFESAPLFIAAHNVTEYEGYYGISARMDVSGETSLGSVDTYSTYSSKIVPIVYHVEGEQTPLFSMLDVLPLLIIVAVMMGAVALVTRKTN